MKAVRIHQFGGVDQLVHEDAPDPVPGPDDALIQVKACALNHLDLFVREGVPAYKTPLPHILGSDIAGIVLTDAGEWHTGDEVIVHPGFSCGDCDYCVNGQDNLCVKFAMPGAHQPGGYAESVAVPTRNLLPKPNNLSWPEAASIPLVFETAYHMLYTRGKVQPGETVVVLAAGSGVGIAAIQLAKIAGCRVIAAASTQTKLDRAAELGADQGVNYTEPDWTKQIRSLTGGEGPHVVVEHVGEATFKDSVKMLRPGGRLVTCGATTGPDAGLDIRFLFSRELSLLGSMLGRLLELRRCVELFDAGKLRPVVDSVFPLSEAAAAHAKMADRNLFGKIVLEPGARI